jgi:hypothetical protein
LETGERTMMKRSNGVATAIVACLLAVGRSSAQPVEAPVDVGYGGYASVEYVAHMPEFERIDDVPSCCPSEYPRTTAAGFQAGIFYRRTLSPKLIAELRLGFSMTGVTIEQIERTIVSGPPDPSQDYLRSPDSAAFAHTIDATFGGIGIGLMAGYRLTGSLRVYAGVAGSVITTKRMSYREHILYPSYIVYAGGNARERNIYDGDIPSAASTMLDLMIGGGYAMAIDRNEHFFIEPQIFYRFGLTSIIDQADGGTWRTTALCGGIAVRYAPLGIPPPPPPGAIPYSGEPPLHPD